MFRNFHLSFAAVLLPWLSVFATGCNRSSNSDVSSSESRRANSVQADESRASKTKSDEAHEHQPGAHGGIIVAIGRDSFHAEAVFDQDGTLRLYTLGKDESRVQEIDSQTLTAYVKPDGGLASSSIELKPEPQPGDSPGKTSQFVGQLPAELKGKAVEVTIPSLTVSGERFRVGFASASTSHDGGMPGKVADDDEKKLYLTPGGLYTEADIKANGNMTASQKFNGFRASHDLKPKPGDKICPVTLTKANPECTWIIGGKKYQFCCPPCVDEFVAQAKSNPELVKKPEDFVKR